MSPLPPFELLLPSPVEELAPVVVCVSGAVVVDVAGASDVLFVDVLAAALSVVRRWAASDITSCSNVVSFARAIVICPARRWASVARERIRTVVGSRVVVVAGGTEVVVVAATPLSAADPPTTAPPTRTAETKIERPLMAPPIPLPSSSD